MKKTIYISITVGLLLSLLFYISVYKPKSTYETAKVKAGSFDKKIFATGIVDSEVIYQLSADSTGKVLKLLAKEGDLVKKGQTLAIIDSVDLQDKINETQYSISKAISSQSSSKSRINEAKAKYNLAHKMLERYTQLRKGGFVSQVEFDNIKLAEVSAKATLDSAYNEQLSSTDEVSRLNSTLAGLKEKLQTYEIKSPSDGVVVQRDIELGDIALAGKVIIKIVNPKDVWVKTFLDEVSSGEIKKGQKAYISLRSKPNQKQIGFVKQIDIVSDAVTEERIIGISFEKTQAQFFLNEQAEVDIVAKQFRSVLQVPAKTIIKENNKNGLWVYLDGEAKFVPVEILARDINTNLVAIKGDIKENDIILVPDTNKKPLVNGASVRI
ncbi:MAG: hypothetical protein KN64_09440 [Sulfurovum sp. AS07-7]|nr:MAG: hypothetical protein KN64_09440 [Sulfurovum sp. AS07-7]